MATKYRKIEISFNILYLLILVYQFTRSQSETFSFSLWHYGFWNKEFFVCSEDFKKNVTVPGNSALECALECASRDPSCLSFNFLSDEKACQIFPTWSKHFRVENQTNITCLYFFQSRKNCLKVL
ncbi:hypothetical protein HELRODRAFT_159678 [Helobdella robusta]|uniref:Apple domain-containing protein n=1 Tax=Helobdella robusta TaxID=6412 RepID=T1EPA9_HELRO|nr:hypothetical protein HELRODRAFT_159678 [Helobdella robusta]ESO13078.1 hypothetical protein HELRODRAFT_159678 [Helobdella robusta]